MNQFCCGVNSEAPCDHASARPRSPGMIVLPAASTRRRRGDCYVAPRADGDDAIVVDDDRAVLDDLVAAHRDDPRAGQSDRAVRDVGLGARSRSASRPPGSGSSSGAPSMNSKESARLAGKAFGAQGPVERRASRRTSAGTPRVSADLATGIELCLGPDRDRLRRRDERRDVGVAALGEGDPLAIGREAELACGLALEMRALDRCRRVRRCAGTLVFRRSRRDSRRGRCRRRTAGGAALARSATDSPPAEGSA